MHILELYQNTISFVFKNGNVCDGTLLYRAPYEGRKRAMEDEVTCAVRWDVMRSRATAAQAGAETGCDITAYCVS